MKTFLAGATAALAVTLVSTLPNAVQAAGISILGDSARVHRVRPDHDWRWNRWDRTRSHHRDLFDPTFRDRAFTHHDRNRVHGDRNRPGFAFQVRPDHNWRWAHEMRRHHTMGGRDLLVRNFRGKSAFPPRDRNRVSRDRDRPGFTFQAGPSHDWQWDRWDGISGISSIVALGIAGSDTIAIITAAPRTAIFAVSPRFEPQEPLANQGRSKEFRVRTVGTGFAGTAEPIGTVWATSRS